MYWWDKLLLKPAWVKELEGSIKGLSRRLDEQSKARAEEREKKLQRDLILDILWQERGHIGYGEEQIAKHLGLGQMEVAPLLQDLRMQGKAWCSDYPGIGRVWYRVSQNGMHR